MRIGVPALRAQLAGKPHSNQRTALEAEVLGLEESMSDCSLGLRAMCDDLVCGRADSSPLLAELLQLPAIDAPSKGTDYTDAGELRVSYCVRRGSVARGSLKLESRKLPASQAICTTFAGCSGLS